MGSLSHPYARAVNVPASAESSGSHSISADRATAPGVQGAAAPGTASRVLVVGAGFGGLYAARSLARHGVSVTLIDKRGYQTFQPLLYQVATGLLPRDVVEYPIHEVHGVESIAAAVDHIDLATSQATFADGTSRSFDYLVLATGASVNFFGTPGASEHALPLYTADDALAIKAALQRAGQADQDLHIVVIGAGPTGVEVTGAIRDVVDYVLPRTFPTMARHQVHLHLIDHANSPLSHFSAESQADATRVLTEAGVVLHMGTKVTEVRDDGVVLEDGSHLAAEVIIWAGGLQVNAPTISPTLTTDSDGRITIDRTLRVSGHDRVYAIGDAAATAADPLPQLGSVAKQQGLHVAQSIRRQLRGQAPKPFSYRDLGEMAMIRHDHAVVEAGPRHHEVTGLAAFTMWLGLHAALLPDNGDRLAAVEAWAHENLTGRSKFLTD